MQKSYSQQRGTLITTISAKGFSIISIGFLISVTGVMLMSMALPAPYSTASVNSTCSLGNTLDCIDTHIRSGTNFTVKVSEIAATNQKVFVYLTYQVATAPRGRVKLTVNSAIYKPKVSGTTVTKYDEVTLFDATSKVHRAFCDEKSLDCSLLLATVESSKKYKDTYVVFNVTSSEISTGLSAPSLSIVYSTPSYTSFEVFWRIALLVAISCFAIFYMVVMRNVPFKFWSIEQKCTLIFVLTLTVSNNGLYSYEFISANEFFPMLNACFDALMICALLMYVLIVMDALRKPLSQRTFFGFYLPRVLLVCTLYTFLVNVYFYNAETSDPIIVMLHDTTNLVLVIFTVLFTTIYFFWLLFAIIRSFSEARKLGEVGYRIKSYGMFTLVAVGILLVFVISDYFLGYKSNQGIYLTLIAYVNIYAIVLIIFYLPSNKNKTEWDTKRKEIVLDELKVTQYDDEDNEMIIEGDTEVDEAIVLRNVTDELLSESEHPIEL